MLHFVVSAMIVISYVFLKAQGVDDETLSFAVAGIVGYWFGASGKAALGKKKSKDTES